MNKKIKEVIPYLIIIIVVLILRTFIATPVRVNGSSMDETLNHGQILILNKLDTDYERGDIVVTKKEAFGTPLIKRVLGLPGETILIENGSLYINNKLLESDYSDYKMDDMPSITLKYNEYFLLGDNRGGSKDSRVFGPVPSEYITGTILTRIYPFNKIGSID